MFLGVVRGLHGTTIQREEKLIRKPIPAWYSMPSLPKERPKLAVDYHMLSTMMLLCMAKHSEYRIRDSHYSILNHNK